MNKYIQKKDPGTAAFIGIGSNLGNSLENCMSGILQIEKNKEASLISKSSFYVTSPISKIEQNDFVNSVIKIIWTASPFDLLEFLNSVEKKMGRQRSIKKGPRIIDLDILFFGNLVINTPSLKIPHPEIHKRKFAIIPCIEIESEIVHPAYEKKLKDFLENIGDEQKISKINSYTTVSL